MVEDIELIEKTYLIQFSKKELYYKNEIISIFKSEELDPYDGKYNLTDKYILGLLGLNLLCRGQIDIALEIINLGIRLDSLRCIYILSTYHLIHNNNPDDAFDFIIKGIEKNHLPSFMNLVTYYEAKNEHDVSLGILKKMIKDFDYIPAYYSIAKLYTYIKNDDYMMKKYFNMGINKKSEACINSYAIYLFENKKIKLGKKILMKGVENNFVSSINMLANRYFIENNIPMAKKYCKIGAELGSLDGLFGLIYMHKKEENEEIVFKYIIQAIKINYWSTVNYLEIFYREKKNQVYDYIDLIDKILLEIIFENSDNKSNIIKMINSHKSSIFQAYPIINNYYEKINNQELKKDDCPICWDEKVCLELPCKHKICKECYKNIDSCYYRCKIQVPPINQFSLG